jgi:hypothetical protein
MIDYAKIIIGVLGKLFAQSPDPDEDAVAAQSEQDKLIHGKTTISVRPDTISIVMPNRTVDQEKVDSIKEKNPFQRISYQKKASDIDKIKKATGIKTLKEIGETTFDYYLEMEIE